MLRQLQLGLRRAVHLSAGARISDRDRLFEGALQRDLPEGKTGSRVPPVT